ncbi:MAG: hypothetical protein IJ647_06815 [Prevotella sp.]|nr:hypothetical protein [Prevotella sp.]
MVITNAINRNAQRSQGSCQSLSVKSTTNGNNSIAKLSSYLKTRDELWRLLAVFPGNMPLVEAIRLAPSVLTKTRKEVSYD